MGTNLLNLFYLGEVGGGTGSCVAWAGFTPLSMWLRVTLNSLPPGPKDGRVKPLPKPALEADL